MVKVYIGGFPLELPDMELELVQLVSRYGEVDTIKVVRDKKTRKCKGYAFIEMPERKQADLAIEELDGTRFKGKILQLSIREVY